MRPRRAGVWGFVAAGLVAAAALTFFIGPHASTKPDGLDKVAIEQGFDQHQRAGATAHAPTARYRVTGVDDAGLSTGLAGLFGVAATFLLGTGVVLVARRLSRRPVATSGR